MSTQLWKNHRTFGYEIARATADDGTELVVLQTAPHKQDVAPAHLLLSVTDADRLFEARVQLIAAIEKARFLGLDMETIRAAFDEAMQSGGGL
jgi:hypothetical protein